MLSRDVISIWLTGTMEVGRTNFRLFSRHIHALCHAASGLNEQNSLALTRERRLGRDLEGISVALAGLDIQLHGSGCSLAHSLASNSRFLRLYACVCTSLYVSFSHCTHPVETQNHKNPIVNPFFLIPALVRSRFLLSSLPRAVRQPSCVCSNTRGATP